MKNLLKLICIGGGILVSLDHTYCMKRSNSSERLQTGEKTVLSNTDQENTWSKEETFWQIPEIYKFLSEHKSHIKNEPQRTHRKLVFTADMEVSFIGTIEEFFELYGNESAEFYNQISASKHYFALYLYHMRVLSFPEIEDKQIIYPLRTVTKDEMHRLFTEFAELMDMFQDDIFRDISQYQDIYQHYGLNNRYQFLNWLAQDQQYIQDYANRKSIRNDIIRKWEAYCSLFAKYELGWATPKSSLFQIKEEK